MGKIGGISLMGQVNFLQTKTYRDSHLCIHELFEKQADKTPNHLAVRFENTSLTYSELNERANQLARFLITQGVEEGSPVLICLERSLDLVVSLLAVLKAGAAYVPIDFEIPKERLNSILSNINTNLVITHSSKSSTFEPHIAQLEHIVFVDHSIWSNLSVQNLDFVYSSDNPMYIIYTSGSTGEPKGVINTHKALNNRLQWMQDYFTLSFDDYVLQKTPYTFDVSVWEFFWPLIFGATIVLAKPGGQKDPQYLKNLIEKEKITTAHFVPSMLDIFLETINNKITTSSLRRVICSGEALTKKLELLFFEKYGDVGLYNLYGPTEAAIDVTYWECTGNLQESTVPIGYPIPNVALHILDENQKPLPQGAIGELYIEGVCLAKGYYRNEKESNKVFIPNFNNENRTVYKTGDLCRYLENGAIEYIGRNDSQVKIRGFRIELKEIESALESHSMVNKCIVQTKTIHSNMHIVAYVTPQSEHMYDEEKLINDLSDILPDYMLPSFIVLLKKFPLLSNGKIDRKQLPNPVDTLKTVKSDESFTYVEKEIQKIWENLLGFKNIALHTSFINIGGNSLFAARLVNRLQDQYQISINLKNIFENPTIYEQAQFVQKQMHESNSTPLLFNNTDEVDLSDAQKRLWFIYQYEKNRSLYNLPHYIVIDGVLNVDILKTSIQTLVNYHDIFRYEIIEEKGIPKLKTLKSANANVKYYDFKSYPQDIAIAKAKKDMYSDAKKPFDFFQNPLYRMTIYKVSDKKYILYYNLHHLISDGWSDELIKKYIFSYYEKIIMNSPLPAKPSIQYQHYVLYEKQFNTSEDFQKQLDYWKELLSEEAKKINLYAKNTTIRSDDQTGRTKTFKLNSELLSKLTKYCEKENCTIYTALLAIYKILLHRLSNEKTISIGTPVANRKQNSFEYVIGMFVNTVVIKNELTSSMSFEQLLHDIQKTSITAFSYDGVPFEKVVEAINPNRKVNENPLFQFMFALLDLPKANMNIDGLSISQTNELHNGTSKFDLTLTIKKDTENFEGIWEYRSDLFEDKFIDQLTNIYQNILLSVVENPKKQLEEIPLLSKNQKEHLLTVINNTTIHFPSSCLHELFEKQVEKTPNQTAVMFEGKFLTYKQLDEYANKLANLILRKSITNIPIGLKMDRSLELIVGILGILKAGCSFLPLEKQIPKSRLFHILENAKSPLCLTDDSEDNMQSQNIEFLQVALSTLESNSISDSKPDCHVTPENLVSIYYTSGSTGNPKGVANTHKGWVNRMCWMQNKHQLNIGDITLQKTTLTFDDAAVEIFWPLIVGGTVALIPANMHKDPQQILKYAVEYNVTLLQFVPSMLQMVIEQITPEQKEKLTNLKTVISSGEALKQKLVNDFYDKMPGKLYNTWGATEVSIDSTCFDCLPISTNDSEIISIGRPIDNTRVYVLDQYLEPVPYGVIGDLYIGGIGLAKGYLNDPEKTNTAFIDDPFIKNERMYKTGDKGYLDIQNNLMFIGREDNQIKIRGMRVELGEIENVITNIPKVKDSIVLSSNDHLVAYFISDDLQAINIQNNLKNHLPYYMLPRYYCKMDSFPLNSNGKKDRKNLPTPSEEHLIIQNLFTTPINQTEEKVLSVWQQKMDINRIGTNDDFFELGGHSLLAVQVVSQINTLFNIQIAVKDIFENPTISSLSTVIDRALNKNIPIENKIPISKDRRKLFPLSHAQKRIWFLNKLNHKADYHMPLVLKFNGLVNIKRLENAFHHLILRHEILRTNFVEKNGEVFQIVRKSIDFSLEIIKMKQFDLQIFIQKQLHINFNLEKDQLIRGTLIRNDSEDILILVLHHIISDGWSLNILKEELFDLYNQNFTKLAAYEPIQYADYALYQNNYVQNLENQLSYWKNKLAGDIPVLDLPTDFSKMKNDNQNSTFKYTLDTHFSNIIKDFCKNLKITSFMLFLGVFYTLLSRLTNQKDIIVGTPIANRNHTLLEKSMGIYLNTLPLRFFVTNESFTQILKKIKRTVQEVFSNQDIPFEKIVEEISPERNLKRNPLFDVMLNYHNFSIEKNYTADHLEVTEEVVDDIMSKFFMTLYIEEKENEFELKLSYQNNLFSKLRIEEFLNQFIHLLHQFIEKPETSIYDTSLITSEAKKILPNPKTLLCSKKYPNIVDEIEYWALLTPSKIAIETETQKFSYHYLNEYSKRISFVLSDKGVHPGNVVALYGERSFEMIGMMIAVIRAGGTFLNIDRRTPISRIKKMLKAANAQFFILTNDEYDSIRLYELFKDQTIKHLKMGELLTYKPSTIINTKNYHDNAYIFFTSGTTGEPKGILGKNNSLSHFLNWQKETFQLCPNDRFAQITNISFDVYLRDVFAALISGATLCIPDEQHIHTNCIQWLEQKQISIIHAVPSISTIWLNNTNIKKMDYLRHIFFAGEPLSSTLVDKWMKITDSQLHNFYGQTETTLAKASYTILNSIENHIAPIGLGISDSQLLILNKQNQLCGIGEPGEITIRSPYLTKGYLHKGKNTFTVNPYSTDLIYKTGDIGRYSPDRNIEILGRVDEQIKIHGVRIDKNEIHSILLNHEKVKECRVLDINNNSQKELVAFITPRDFTLNADDLRIWLTKELPIAMVPNKFVFVNTLPVTTNGKIDKNKLLSLLKTPSEPNSKAANFETIWEQKLQVIWKDLFTTTSFSPHDNFFELGGHSLLIIKMVAIIKERWNVELDLLDIFHYPTIRDLATKIEQLESNSQNSLPKIKKIKRSQYVYTQNE